MTIIFYILSCKLGLFVLRRAKKKVPTFVGTFHQISSKPFTPP